MANQDNSINVFGQSAGATAPASKLYKVYLHTQDDPAVQELVVSASNVQAAKQKALGHVKKSNPHKGARSHSDAVKVTKVLSARETGTNGCVAIHKIPLDVFTSAALAVNS
ncbi:MAG TPA: hypothetical protein PK620_03365 [Denitromonas sp.]|uniref:hypothetical protein n=1 Tax=Denitromonas sp. TaxID=2734609 RepID=UPI001DDAA5A0|nr:hypothetical protein [Rhodocyclaceae bacterium]MCP5223433.1 hypothetical protein [Zoogloeaceae bacterium]HPR06246.1 hypothetical protein [Denitromonas sp.]HQU88117.1 hypothetical protein [Denitromonas sp.]HQV13932.1 hypothetical protein [Denitromonas sp.]